MKTRLTPPGLVTGGRRRLAVGMMTLLLGLVMTPAQAAQSNPTGGRIHGRAPTVTGNLKILLPDGVTPLTNNMPVNWNLKIDDFTLAPLTDGLTYSDDDGDAPSPVGTPGFALTNPPWRIWGWHTAGGALLTPAQRSQPLKDNFADGTVLKVYVDVSLDVTSSSGMPNTNRVTRTSGTLEFVVKAPPPPPRVYVNGTTFAIDAGFPKTGFVGANFQFYMNGTNAAANSNYTYTTNQPAWTSVSSTGVVKFTQMPTTAQKSVTITITDTAGVDVPRAYTFTPNLWFVNGGSTKRLAAEADAYCAGLGNGYATPGNNIMTNAGYGKYGTRAADGRLYDEWGPVQAFGAGWVSGFYWVTGQTWTSLSRDYVRLTDGLLAADYNIYARTETACVRLL